MKLKENLLLRQVAGNWVVLPLAGTELNAGDMLSLNDAGAMLWQVLEKNPDPQALVDALTAEYDVSEEQAREDVAAFLQRLLSAGCMDET